MLKAEALEHGAVDWVIKHTDCIPVDRTAGAGAYAGAVRMALEARVPIVPLIIWGPQRMWTKDHPKNLGRKRIPWIIRAGEPAPPRGTMAELDARLRATMTTVLHEVQEQYPHPPGAWWVPHRLGGEAPTPEEAKRLDETELIERARRAAERH